jgi:TRAP-type C4-dicarboxylate transport system permease large subunit
MLMVIVPFGILIVVAFFKKIPVIGGDIRVGLLLSALSAFLLGGVYNPLDWFSAWVFGIDKLSWILFLVFLGGIYAQLQDEIKAVDTVFDFLRATLGKTPKLMIFVIMLTLTIAGSLLGDAIAAATVIGVLAVGILLELGLTGAQAAATLTMGAALGSIMPPITQAIFLSASLLDVSDPTPAVNIGYLTVGAGLILSSIYVARWVTIDKIPDKLMPNKSGSQIMKDGYKRLIPLAVLVVIVVLKAGFKIDVFAPLDPIFAEISKVPILKGLSFRINKALLFCGLLSLFYANIRKNPIAVIAKGAKKTMLPMFVLICAALMIGAYYKAGQIEAVTAAAVNINSNLLKISGAASMTLMGMLTGSQTTTQTTIFSVIGPAFVANGIDPIKAVIAGSHLAMSGQGMPPADLITFVTAGLVGGITGIKVDPLRAMFYAMPLCFYFMLIGIIFLYI